MTPLLNNPGRGRMKTMIISWGKVDNSKEEGMTGSKRFDGAGGKTTFESRFDTHFARDVGIVFKRLCHVTVRLDDTSICLVAKFERFIVIGGGVIGIRCRGATSGTDELVE